MSDVSGETLPASWTSTGEADLRSARAGEVIRKATGEAWCEKALRRTGRGAANISEEYMMFVGELGEVRENGKSGMVVRSNLDLTRAVLGEVVMT